MAEEQLKQLPDDLQPHKKVETLAIEIPDKAVVANISPEDLPDIAEEFKMVGLTRKQIQELGVLGINLESIGSVQVANGINMVSMKCCMAILQKLHEDGTKTFENALKAGPVAASLLKALTPASNSFKTKLPTAAKAAPGPTRKPSFAANAPININQAVVNVNGEQRE